MFDPGTTAPLLAISRHFGSDYRHVLRYADFLVHGRGGVDLPTLVELNPDAKPLISEHAAWMKSQHGIADRLFEQGRLVFQDGRWSQRDA